MSTLTECYTFLAYDLLLWSSLRLRGPWYDWQRASIDLVLHHSDGMRVLFIGQAGESMKAGYANMPNYYVTPVSRFRSLETFHVPQTTCAGPVCYGAHAGHRPDASFIETATRLADEIYKRHHDFDTALLACGAYAAPLIALLQQECRFGRRSRNLINVASTAYIIFGVQTRGINGSEVHSVQYAQDGNVVRAERAIRPVESMSRASGKLIDDGKYW